MSRRIILSRGPTRRWVSGYTITEVVGAVLMLGVFLLISTQIFHSGVKLAHDAQVRSSEIARLEGVTATMRADVWDAQEMTSKDGSEVVIRQAGDQQVTWRIESGSVRRTLSLKENAPQERRWQGVGTKLSFAIEGPVLIFRDSGAPPGSVNERRLVSQVRLAEAVR
jgi:hypothetical protein